MREDEIEEELKTFRAEVRVEKFSPADHILSCLLSRAYFLLTFFSITRNLNVLKEKMSTLLVITILS
jgi:hypothetical protein